MTGPVARLLPDAERLHLQHGPIDLVIGADGAPGAREAAFRAACARFETVLGELVGELPLLRRPTRVTPRGTVARRMAAATLPHADRVFITPMAAVAGAVAEEILAAACTGAPLDRAYVNNGGDIALHLAPGACFAIAIAGPEGQDFGRIALGHADPVRGIATSGQRGRSLSFGIADGVTVLAETAACADAAATLIANDVDLPGHPSIRRLRACDVQADSDLGERLVARQAGPLSPTDVHRALDRGARTAEAMRRAGQIHSAALFLRGQVTTVGQGNRCLIATPKERDHA
ncbi:MAG: UPF0280 family protein [Fuscovulum sp.]|nr:UPF0280 family protein [Fuscovulum sp.]